MGTPPVCAHAQKTHSHALLTEGMRVRRTSFTGGFLWGPGLEMGGVCCYKLG